MTATTTTTKANKTTTDCAPLITDRNIAGLRLAAYAGADFSNECFQYTCADGTTFTDLTALSLAVLVDADNDALLMLPLVLYLGGNVRQVDSKGRTLLHFARTRRMARYLLAHGVPVAPNTRTKLVAAFRKTPGTGTFDDTAGLGLKDTVGAEPDILRAVRQGTAGLYTRKEAPAIPKGRWKTVLTESLYNGLLGVGFNEPDHVREARDPCASIESHGLVAELSPTNEIGPAVLEGNLRQVRALLKLGARTDCAVFTYETTREGRAFLYTGVTPVGLAVLSNADAIEDNARLPPVGPGATQKAAPEDGLDVLPLFEGYTDFSGVHADGGQTLMHLALEPVIARWLVERGAPCDVPDANGLPPADVLPVASAAVALRVALGGKLPPGATPFTTRQKRL
jgi:hypothetical protein